MNINECTDVAEILAEYNALVFAKQMLEEENRRLRADLAAALQVTTRSTIEHVKSNELVKIKCG